MCYTFDFLAPRDDQRRQGAHRCSRTSSRSRPTAGRAGPSPTTTSCATPRAGASARPTAPPISRLVSALLLSLRGSVCLYQGEELGLTEAELAFEDLQDPYGIRFWPEFKGRDGCRTPMVWDADSAERRLLRRRSPGCRCRRSIWPARSTRRRATPASLLEHYRRFLAFRRRASGARQGRHRLPGGRRRRASPSPARDGQRARSSAPSISARSRRRSRLPAGRAGSR